MANKFNAPKKIDAEPKIILSGIGGFFLYTAVLLGAQVPCLPKFNEKIKSKEELEMVVKEETEKLNLDYSKLKVNYGIMGPRIWTKDKEHFVLDMDSTVANRKLIKHELYHMLKDFRNINESKLIEFLKYYFVQEPRATMYASFNIKL